MKKQLPFALFAAALVAALAVAVNWPSDAQHRAMATSQHTKYQTAQNETAAAPEPIHMVADNARLDAGPRIIHVPQANEPRAVGNDRSDIEDAVPADDVEIQQPKRPLARPRHVVTAPPPMPRRVLPPAETASKRTVLSAPTTAGALTPIYPTPRWRATDKVSEPTQADGNDTSALDLPPEADTSLPR